MERPLSRCPPPSTHLCVRELLHEPLLALHGVRARLLHGQRHEADHQLEGDVALGHQDEDLGAREALRVRARVAGREWGKGPLPQDGAHARYPFPKPDTGSEACAAP